MISHKYMTKIVGVMVAVAVALCFLAMLFSQRIVETLGGNVVALQYPTKLFDTDTPIEIDIRMAEGEWKTPWRRSIMPAMWSSTGKK